MVRVSLALRAVPNSPPATAGSASVLWPPSGASTSAVHVDHLLVSLVVLSAAAATILLLVTLIVLTRPRTAPRSPSSAGQSRWVPLELACTVLPLALVATLFHQGLLGYLDLRIAPSEAIEISGLAQRGRWHFGYPNGLTDEALHVPVDTPVKLVLSAQDAVQGLHLPAFRTSVDAIPGLSTDLWFHATAVGVFPAYCGERCGWPHAAGHTSVVVHEPGGYEKWLEAREQAATKKPPAEIGANSFLVLGCATCHSVDGTPLVGPTVKSLLGREVVLADGTTVIADVAYVKEAILQPQARIVQGYAPAMPAYQGKLSDAELAGLIEFFKTLD